MGADSLTLTCFRIEAAGDDPGDPMRWGSAVRRFQASRTAASCWDWRVASPVGALGLETARRRRPPRGASALTNQALVAPRCRFRPVRCRWVSLRCGRRARFHSLKARIRMKESAGAAGRGKSRTPARQPTPAVKAEAGPGTNRRNEIKAIVARRFAEFGFDSTTTREIAQDAKMLSGRDRKSVV